MKQDRARDRKDAATGASASESSEPRSGTSLLLVTGGDRDVVVVEPGDLAALRIESHHGH